MDLKEMLTSRYGDLTRAGVAECVATGILVLFGCGTCGAGNVEVEMLGVKGSTGPKMGLLAVALIFGLVIMALASSFGHVSGCHINPAVTLGVLIDGQIDILKAVVYWIAQFLGAVLGASILYFMQPETSRNLCQTNLAESLINGPVAAIVLEAFITFLLVFVVCNVCESNPTFAPLAIGLTVTVGHLLAMPYTGASMNTARTFGPALIGNHWTHHYVYWIGPLAGGALAGAAHRFFFFNKDKDQSKPAKKADAPPPPAGTNNELV